MRGPQGRSIAQGPAAPRESRRRHRPTAPPSAPWWPVDAASALRARRLPNGAVGDHARERWVCGCGSASAGARPEGGLGKAVPRKGGPPRPGKVGREAPARIGPRDREAPQAGHATRNRTGAVSDENGGHHALARLQDARSLDAPLSLQSRRAQSAQSAQSAMVNHDAPHTTRPRTAAFEVTSSANPVPQHLSHAALNVDLHLLRPRARTTRDRRTLLAGHSARAGGRARARRTRSACWGLARRGGGRARGVDLERRLGRHQRDLPVAHSLPKEAIADDSR